MENTVNKREFSVAESVFAWLSLVAGYFFCRVFPGIVKPLGSLIFAVLLFIVTAVVIKIKGARFSVMSVVVGVSALIISAALFLSSNSFVHFFSYGFVIVSYFYFVYSAFGNNLEKGFSNLLMADYFKALFVMPFVSIVSVFYALSNGRGKNGLKILLKVLLGLAIAIIPTAIVTALLSYDSGFVAILKDLFRIDIATVISNVFSVIFGIPVGMYIFGAYVSAADNKCEQVCSAEGFKKAAKTTRFVSQVTALVAVVPLLFLYVVFFISQWKYYVSGFVGVLPDETTYAEYARDGFFQLCAVSVINFFVIMALSVFMRRNKNDDSTLLKILNIVFSLFTLVLISTAMAKMYLYINRFGLTPKRVYASWFMLVLTLVFVLVIIKQIFKRFRLIPTAFFVTVVMFAVVSLLGTEEYIAKYNVDRYLNKTLTSVDVSALQELGDSSVPQLVRLVKAIDEKEGTSIKDSLADRNYQWYEKKDEMSETEIIYNQAADALYEYINGDKQSAFAITLPKIRANNALKKADLLKK